jgi:hypothetical protein
MHRCKEHRGVDVALMVRAVDGGSRREIFGARDPVADAAQRHTEPNTQVSEHVEVTLGAKRAGDEHPGG